MTKSKFPFVAIFFPIALIVCTIVRFFQYSTVVLPENGFFSYDGGFWNNAYYIIFAITAALFLALTIVDKKSERGILRNKSANLKISKVSSIIGALLSFSCGFLLGLETVAAFQGDTPMIQSVTMALAALGYSFIGYVVFADKKLLPVTALSFLFIAALYVCTAAVMFMERIYTVNLSARLITLSVYLLLAVFFLCCGRILVRSETRFTSITATICGYSLVLLAVSDSVSRIIYYNTSDGTLQNALIVKENGFELPTPLFIVQGIAVLWIIFALSLKKKNEKIEEENDNEIENLED